MESTEALPPPSAPAPPELLGHLARAVDGVEAVRRTGRVSQVTGLVIESAGPAAVVGEVCRIHPEDGTPAVDAEVVGFRSNRMLLMPLDEVSGIGPGCRVVATGRPLSVPVGDQLLGRVLDGLGRPADGRGPLRCRSRRPILATPTPPMHRPRIAQPLATGVRAIDGFLSLGRGQRVGVFSGSGVGKSVLVGQIARCCDADVVVVGLVGERGREVREFLDKNLGEKGLKKSVVVAVTSDDLALRRIKGAFVATTIAEHFRDQGRNVVLFLDSITRFAYAQRELGLSIGEPPTTRGYTPSVFATLPRLVERAGTTPRGAITGIYTVLVEGDDLDEPVSDAARSVLDGHIVLSRDLVVRNHYPAIDILQSLSRSMPDVVSPQHMEAAGAVRRLYATYRNSEELLRLGAYTRGSSPQLDLAISLVGEIEEYLRQPLDEKAPYARSVERLVDGLATKISRA
ncbi:MAG: FliI/YscN family ATPase [Candidatus Brocadiia bacterium]